MGSKQTPQDLREGVRSGILASLKRDFEMRGGRTARLLAAAGIIGVAGALGITLVMVGHPFDHHPPWHVAVFSSIWAGLLVVTLSFVFLGVRTHSLPLARAAAIAVLGLGLAGVCGAVCPDQHFLHWWASTAPGHELTGVCGAVCSVLCFGLVTSLFIALVAALVGLVRYDGPPLQPGLPALMLFILLTPGIALQSYGSSWTAVGGWLVGAIVGSYAGIAAASSLRTLGRRVA
jgi:hypothetical protein